MSAVSASEDTIEDDDLEDIAFLQNALFVLDPKRKKPRIDHRVLPRNTRTKYRHKEATHCIQRDYIGVVGDPTTPLFKGKEFDTMFRVSRGRFQRLLEDIGNSGDPFYLETRDCFGNEVASMEARILLPLKCLAFGVPPKTFRDYFQMSKTFARECCINFNRKVKELYQEEYLRFPTQADLKAITKLHRNVHKGVNGMFGSLDCMHTFWKNCPVAWQGSYKGAKSKPSIVLEAISDHHLWFWHCSYGYAGTLNDINIFNLSPLLERFMDGTFQDIESAVTPFEIAGQSFDQLFILVDGIYPRYSRFVKAIKEPITKREKRFTTFQESARKDIERAFGVLQCKFQAMAKPIYIMDMALIGEMVCCCLILHNMCVSDRVMAGDVRAVYDPSNSLEPEEEEAIEYPSTVPQECVELARERSKNKQTERAKTCIRHADQNVRKLLLQKQRWCELKSLEEYLRLMEAIIDSLDG